MYSPSVMALRSLSSSWLSDLRGGLVGSELDEDCCVSTLSICS